MKVRKIPVEVEAVLWDGSNDKFEQISLLGTRRVDRVADTDQLIIETLEGNMIANRGDYIIKGVVGEIYPCKPDIFIKTYEITKP